MAGNISPFKEKSFAKTAAIQLVAGGSAGCIEVCIMHPLDLVKTRLQIQANTQIQGVVHYNGLRDCFLQMYRSEGVLSFWKGIVPPILVETPKRAWKFFTFEQFQQVFLFGSDKPTALVKMQANRAHQSVAPSSGNVVREIIKTDGIFGSSGLLGKGITATMGRNGFFNMIYFGFYHTFKDIVPQADNSKLEFGRKVLIGFLGGTLACCFNIPFDVAKSRIQGPQAVGVEKYQGTIRVILRVYKEEGFLALYRGLVPKILRLGPGGAIMLVIYEQVSEYLTHRFM
ncbi:mitochondrial 2-oxodicarboxylate carrier [Eurytemora carolleeae]|uniref:mitochondrial 2-oxodicarboxylate carrier n=1 Tax=Eurytemora carolleeae TaxID=1294199 RepID=UPI000C769500|nr:mitochondrial 2-oxodicarboxylate carrier [Eurytemora carolleeae]|eukprot:XP_023341461.1 mitochondrial 2-oxodicarboxylate carrier-like [Eurytemora affinis]